MVQSFQAIEGTIRAYTIYTLNAFKKVAIANVDKVTLEFGIKLVVKRHSLCYERDSSEQLKDYCRVFLSR
jgi:hypothetical protein